MEYFLLTVLADITARLVVAWVSKKRNNRQPLQGLGGNTIPHRGLKPAIYRKHRGSLRLDEKNVDGYMVRYLPWEKS